MGNKRPAWNKYEVTKNDFGRKLIRGLNCFLVVQPNNIPLFWTCRRKMKDACMAFEEHFDMDWEDAAAQGYSVMKLFGTAMCKTDESIRSIDSWVVEVDTFEEVSA